MKVALLLGSLGCGGAERVVSRMANFWVSQGRSVAVITLSSVETDFFELDPLVRRIALDVAKPSTNMFIGGLRNIYRVRHLRKTLRQLEPQAVISFTPSANVLTLLSSIRLKHSVIISEVSAPSHDNLTLAWSLLRRMVYVRADGIVAQTPRIAAWLNERFPHTSIAIIPNPIDVQLPSWSGVPGNLSMGMRQHETQSILAIGRLIKAKGFDLLLHACAQLSTQFNDWKLIILGEGPERPNLEALIRNLGVGNRVHLAGLVVDTEAYLAQADVFVLSSRYEGMPNALMEALACGVPSISFDCPTGPRELIRDGENGILVPAEDVAALTVAIAKVMGNAALRQRLSAAAISSMLSFRLDVVMHQWDELLNRVRLAEA